MGTYCSLIDRATSVHTTSRQPIHAYSLIVVMHINHTEHQMFLCILFVHFI